MPPYWKKTKRKRTRQNRTDEVLKYANKAVEEKLTKEKLVAEGVAIHSVINKRTSSKYLQDVRDYSDTNLTDRDTVVKLARKLRSFEGVCSTVADLLLDFAVTKGRFISDNKELELLLNKWQNYVNSAGGVLQKETVLPVPGLREVSRKIVDSYFTDGDAVFTLFWQKNSKLLPDDDAAFLPIGIKVLDVLLLDIDEGLSQLGNERIVLKLSTKIKEKILNPKTDADKFLSKSIPKDWIKLLRDKKDIVLDPNVTFHIKRNSKDYKAWGETLFLKAFTAIANKRRLQAVDEATIDGLINRFTIFKLGLPDAEKNEAYHIPSKARAQSLIDVLTNPKRTNAIVWPGPDLDVIDIGPDGKVLEFVEKYQQTDKDILRALHVSPLLIDGGSSGQSVRDWAAFVSTEVGLDYIRNSLEKIYEQIGIDIAIANNIQFERLFYKFDTQLLKDEKRVRNFALKVFELGGISIETFVNTMGYDFDTEKERLIEEEAENLQDIFVNKTLPFQGNPTVEPDGRPVDTTNTDRNVEDSPNTKAAVKETKDDYLPLYNSVFEKLKEDLINKRDVSDDFGVILLSLVAGFSTLRVLIESQLRDVFNRTVNRVGQYQEELNFLLAWNNKFVNNFFNDMKQELEAVFFDVDEFKNIVDKQRYRVLLYAQESHRKAEFLGEFAKASEVGIKEGRWLTTIDDVTCPVCLGNDNKIFKLSTLLDIFPSHPNCRCIIEMLKGGK